MKEIKSHDKPKPTPNITNLVTGSTLEEAYAWVLEQRKNHSANKCIRHLHHHWPTIKPSLQESILNGRLYTTHLKMLRKVTEITHRVLNALQLKRHPDKTFLGCIKKGFDFLGVHFGKTPKISRTRVENHQTRISLHYTKHQIPALIPHYRA